MRKLAIVLVVAAAAAVSCGDDDGGSEPGTDSDTNGTGDSCLAGAWECTLPDGSTAQMTISGDMIDGSFSMAGATATVMATITVDGNAVTVVDTGGTGACPMAQAGEYTFACSDTSLNFTLVSDDCMGRMNFFGCAWTRP